MDDSPLALRVVQSILQREQYDVVTARDGNEGLEKAASHAPDVIVTDSIMPGLDGYGLLRRLRADPATSLIPVIMLTSSDPEESGRHVGDGPRPDVVLTKSADPAPLLAEVREALRRRRAPADPAT